MSKPSIDLSKSIAEYLEALNKCCDAVKLTALATRECAKQTEKVAKESLLAAYRVKEALHEKAG